MYYVFIDDVQWAHLHAYFDPSIRRESYVTIVQAARIIPRIIGMPYRVPTEARIAFNKVRLGYPIFPLFSVDESHYLCPLSGNEEQTYFHCIFEIAPTNGQQAALA